MQDNLIRKKYASACRSLTGGNVDFNADRLPITNNFPQWTSKGKIGPFMWRALTSVYVPGFTLVDSIKKQYNNHHLSCTHRGGNGMASLILNSIHEDNELNAILQDVRIVNTDIMYNGQTGGPFIRGINYYLKNYLDNYDEDVFYLEGSTTLGMNNVKGQDLLTIDKEGELTENDKSKYQLLGLEPKPFKNVSYFYPYSKSEANHHMQTFGNWEEIVYSQWNKDKLGIFKYTWEACKDRLEYIFANEDIDDSSGTMAAVIAYIESEKSPFTSIGSWAKFKSVMKDLLNDKEQIGKTNIPLVSWKKFNRVMDKVLCDEVFTDDVAEDSREVVLSETLKSIKPNEVRVIDIAHLDEKSQGFVFGDVMDTLHSMMSAKSIDGMPDKIVVFVDELNKYASKDTPKSSQILQQLLEITERGRSLGLILFSVEQFKSAIHERVKGNCATSAYGRTNFVEVANSEYRYYGETYRNMMTRLDPGEYIISNPAMRSLMKINFPRPVYKENK